MHPIAPRTCRNVRDGLLALLLVFAPSLGPAAGPALADGEPITEIEHWTPGQFYVKALPGGDIGTIAADHGLRLLGSFDPYHLLASTSEVDDRVQLELLVADPRLDWAELAYHQRTPESARQMVVAVVGGTVEDFTTQDVYARLRLGEIHGHVRGTGIVVAVIDTGVDLDHPALEGQLLGGGIDYIDGDLEPDETANRRDDDFDGLIDEGAGHGTMVAGIVNLVAPQALILPIRALDDDGNGSAFDVARGIHHAIASGVDVINLSLGLPEYSRIIDEAILEADAAGVLVVTAAGNDATNDPAYFPASSPATLSVTSVDLADVKSAFANYHETVDLSAPGEWILAPFIGGGYAVGSGTSFATPFVSGQSALVLSVHPGATKEETESHIARGTIRVDHLIGNVPYTGQLGSGRFDGARTWEEIEPIVSASPDLAQAGSGLQWTPNPAAVGTSVFLRTGPFPAEAVSVEIALYDAQGRHLRSFRREGAGDVEWDGTLEGGGSAPAGVYFSNTTYFTSDGTPLLGPGARLVRIR